MPLWGNNHLPLTLISCPYGTIITCHCELQRLRSDLRKNHLIFTTQEISLLNVKGCEKMSPLLCGMLMVYELQPLLCDILMVYEEGITSQLYIKLRCSLMYCVMLSKGSLLSWLLKEGQGRRSIIDWPYTVIRLVGYVVIYLAIKVIRFQITQRCHQNDLKYVILINLFRAIILFPSKWHKNQLSSCSRSAFFRALKSYCFVSHTNYDVCSRTQCRHMLMRYIYIWYHCNHSLCLKTYFSGISTNFLWKDTQAFPF